MEKVFRSFFSAFPFHVLVWSDTYFEYDRFVASIFLGGDGKQGLGLA